MANKIYPAFKLALLKSEVELESAVIKLALVTNAYTADDAHDFFADVTNEVSATGYTAGGETVDNQTVSLDSTTGVFDFDPITWNISGGITYRAAVLYVSTGDPATSRLIAYYDFGTDQVLAGNGTATVSPHATGALRAS
jgi:hypothetical protein